MKFLRRMALWLLVFGMLTGITGAYAISGQHYETFEQYYQEDLTFINENDSRHLLPLVIASRDSDENDGRLFYEIYGDVLSLTVRTDPTGDVIELCQIVMTAPQGMEYGGSVYNDFATAGYHSYAMLMAMDTRETARERYNLVIDVVNGMAQGNGEYSTLVGVYNLTCTRVGNVATLSFENTMVTPTEAPDETDAADDVTDSENTPAPAEESDEGAGLG